MAVLNDLLMPRFVIMDGFVAVTSAWARVYFMLFYIVTVVGSKGCTVL